MRSEQRSRGRFRHRPHLRQPSMHLVQTALPAAAFPESGQCREHDAGPVSPVALLAMPLSQRLGAALGLAIVAGRPDELDRPPLDLGIVGKGALHSLDRRLGFTSVPSLICVTRSDGTSPRRKSLARARDQRLPPPGRPAPTASRHRRARRLRRRHRGRGPALRGGRRPPCSARRSHCCSRPHWRHTARAPVAAREARTPS